MSSGTQIDYDALAAQHGGTAAPAVDYDALAAQHGGTAVQSPDQPKGLKDQLADFGRNLWQQINPVAGLKGLAQATSHPINALNADANARTPIVDKAYQTFQQAHQEEQKGNYGKAADLYSGGAAHWLYGHIPFLGETLDKAGTDFQQGNYGAGAGASVGLGLNIAGSKALADAGVMQNIVKPQAQSFAEKLYKSTLKPSTTFSDAERASMTQAGLDNAIPITEGGMTKLRGLIDDLNSKISAQIKGGAQAGATVDPSAIASRLNQTRARFTNQVLPDEDLATIDAAKDQFLKNQQNPIPVDQAQTLKTGTYQQLRGKYGELGAARVESEKALARGIKEELENQFPEIKNLNAQEAKLINLDEPLERAVNRIANRNLISLTGRIASGAAGTMIGAGGGGISGAGEGALATLVLHEVATNPMVQSRLAIALSKFGKVAPSVARQRIYQYANQLGQAANAAGLGDQAAPAQSGLPQAQ